MRVPVLGTVHRGIERLDLPGYREGGDGDHRCVERGRVSSPSGRFACSWRTRPVNFRRGCLRAGSRHRGHRSGAVYDVTRLSAAQLSALFDCAKTHSLAVYHVTAKYPTSEHYQLATIPQHN
jgi:hypothetical protein